MKTKNTYAGPVDFNLTVNGSHISGVGIPAWQAFTLIRDWLKRIEPKKAVKRG